MSRNCTGLVDDGDDRLLWLPYILDRIMVRARWAHRQSVAHTSRNRHGRADDGRARQLRREPRGVRASRSPHSAEHPHRHDGVRLRLFFWCRLIYVRSIPRASRCADTGSLPRWIAQMILRWRSSDDVTRRGRPPLSGRAPHHCSSARPGREIGTVQPSNLFRMHSSAKPLNLSRCRRHRANRHSGDFLRGAPVVDLVELVRRRTRCPGNPTEA